MIITESRKLTYKIEDLMLKLTDDINHLDYRIKMEYPSSISGLELDLEGLKLLNELKDKEDARQQLELMNYFYKKGTLTDSDLETFNDCLEDLIGFRFDCIGKSKLTRKTLSSPHLMALSYGGAT